MGKMGLVKKAGDFLKETEIEARKVVWPERKYVFAATIIVLVIVISCALFVMFVDLGYYKLFEFLTKLVRPGY